MMNRRRLTAREVAVVGLVAQGHTNGEIAADLGVSLATVKRHMNNIMIKWNCNNRTQVAVQATLRHAETTAAPPSPQALESWRSLDVEGGAVGARPDGRRAGARAGARGLPPITSPILGP